MVQKNKFIQPVMIPGCEMYTAFAFAEAFFIQRNQQLN
jgi:hypothetical protein